MKPNVSDTPPTMIRVTVDPGICGFNCVIKARQLERRTVSIEITDSQCEMIKQMAEGIPTISLKELFTPMTQNPVYKNAEKSGCHASCVIPSAILKTAEVAMEMALPKDVCIRFNPFSGSDTNEK